MTTKNLGTSLMPKLGLMLVALTFTWTWVGQVGAEIVTLDATGRGSMSTYLGGSDNGNYPLVDDYYAGSNQQYKNRSHFDFSIPEFEGVLTSATLNLYNRPLVPGYFGFPGSHYGGTNTYTLYSLGEWGTYTFEGIGTGTVYGAIDISGNGNIDIQLNEAALAAITAAQGETFSLGGVNSSENSGGYIGDFASTDGYFSRLTFEFKAAEVPEPSSLILLGGLGLISLVGFIWRQKK